MPVKENEFNVSSLWPLSNHHWMATGAVQAQTQMYGQGLDLGALRVRGGYWEIVIAGEWVFFRPDNAEHFLYASAFRRYGPGWGYGPAHGMHDEVAGYFQELYGRSPTAMEKLDIEHDRGLWQKLLADHAVAFPPVPEPEKPVPGKPTEPEKPPAPVEPPVVVPPPVPPPPVVPPAPSLSPLSPAPQRAEELWSLAAPIAVLIGRLLRWDQPSQKTKQLWLVGKPLAVALIEAWRRRGRTCHDQ